MNKIIGMPRIMAKFYRGIEGPFWEISVMDTHFNSTELFKGGYTQSKIDIVNFLYPGKDVWIKQPNIILLQEKTSFQ